MTDLFWNAGEQRIRAFWRLGIFVAVWLFLTIAVTLPAALLGLGFDPIGSPPKAAIAFGLQAVATVAAVIICAFIDRRPFRDYGLAPRGPFWRELILGYLLGAALMVFIFGVLYAAGSVRVVRVRLDSAAFTALGLYALCHLFVGIYEELLSRGYLQLNLEDGFRGPRLGYRGAAWLAVLLTSLFFSLLHAVNPNITAMALLNLVITGVALAIPVLLTRRLGLSIGIHAAWNVVQSSVLGFAVSGQAVKDPILQIRVTGPTWLTGGAFGPEAGVLDIAASILLVLVCAGYAKLALGEAKVQPPPELAAKPAPVAVQASASESLEISELQQDDRSDDASDRLV